MTATNKQKAVLKVTADIRGQILNGSFPAGMALSQEEIANTFAVSRTPVREAFQILAGEELIEIASSGRATVTAISPSDVLERFELRALIETKLIGLAIPVMSADNIAEAKVLAAKLQSCTAEQWTEYNYQLHEALYRPANRPTMQKFVKELYYRHYSRLHSLEKSRRNVPRSLHEHNELIALCEEGDVEGACYKLEAHIMMGGYALVEQLKALLNKENLKPR
jgi:DNA-binding GntR family transcriptional regulator